MPGEGHGATFSVSAPLLDSREGEKSAGDFSPGALVPMPSVVDDLGQCLVSVASGIGPLYSVYLVSPVVSPEMGAGSDSASAGRYWVSLEVFLGVSVVLVLNVVATSHARQRLWYRLAGRGYVVGLRSKRVARSRLLGVMGLPFMVMAALAWVWSKPSVSVVAALLCQMMMLVLFVRRMQSMPSTLVNLNSLFRLHRPEDVMAGVTNLVYISENSLRNAAILERSRLSRWWCSRSVYDWDHLAVVARQLQSGELVLPANVTPYERLPFWSWTKFGFDYMDMLAHSSDVQDRRFFFVLQAVGVSGGLVTVLIQLAAKWTAGSEHTANT